MLAHSFNRHTTNKGSVLAISLVILTAITLVSITAMQRSGLQGKMVVNIQHKEKAFHAANSELEEIFEFYLTQGSARKALAGPINTYTVTDGIRVYTQVDTGHTSPYNSISLKQTSSAGFGSGGQNGNAAPQLQVVSTVIAEAPGMPDGYSYGSFESHNLEITTSSSRPNIGSRAGDVLSSQSIGISFVSPSGS